MMTSSKNISRVTGHLCGEFTGPRWIPRTKASDAELWCFFYLRLNKRLSKQSRGWWIEMLSRPLWRHRNVQTGFFCSEHYSMLHTCINGEGLLYTHNLISRPRVSLGPWHSNVSSGDIMLQTIVTNIVGVVLCNTAFQFVKNIHI